MTTVIRDLIDVLSRRDNKQSLVALQTLQYTPPFSLPLVDVITKIPQPSQLTQPQSRTLLAVTKRFTFDDDTCRRLQEWWTKKPFCARTLLGIFYAKGSYGGFVRDRVVAEFLSGNFTFSHL